MYRAVSVVFFFLLWTHDLGAQTPFYQGKTVTVVV